MEDFLEKIEKKKRRKKIRKIVFLLILILILSTIFAVYMLNDEFKHWMDLNVLFKEVQEGNVPYIELAEGENTDVYAYNKYIVTFSKKSLTFYNYLAEEENSIELELNNPIFNSKGKYLVIAEEEGQKVYLIKDKNVLWEQEVEGKISQIIVNKNGYVALAITDTSDKTVVSVYNKNGKNLFNSHLATAIVSDMTISDDDEYLAIAKIDSTGVILQSSLRIISISKAQTEPKESVIYQTQEENNRILININYQEKNKLICMYDDSIEIVKNGEKKKILETGLNNATYMSIKLKNNIITVEEKLTGEYTADSYVTIINTDTEKTKQYVAENISKEIYTNENKIALNFGTELHIINTFGTTKKRYISTQEINKVVLSNKIAGVIYRDKIEILDL